MARTFNIGTILKNKPKHTKGFRSGLLHRADKRQNVRIFARRRAKFLATNIGIISRNMPIHTNFKLKRLKPKLDIVEKPENRVHKQLLTLRSGLGLWLVSLVRIE